MPVDNTHTAQLMRKQRNVPLLNHLVNRYGTTAERSDSTAHFTITSLIKDAGEKALIVCGSMNIRTKTATISRATATINTEYGG